MEVYKIDMNEPSEFTINNLKIILEAGDETINNQLRITDDGILFLSQDVGTTNLDGIKSRLETFGSYTNCVGGDISDDKEWLERVYKGIKKIWEEEIAYCDQY
jgi:hypothetical protein